MKNYFIFLLNKVRDSETAKCKSMKKIQSIEKDNQ